MTGKDALKKSEDMEICSIREKYAKIRATIEKRRNCVHDYKDNTAFHDSGTEHVCTKCGNVQINLDSWLKLNNG